MKLNIRLISIDSRLNKANINLKILQQPSSLLGSCYLCSANAHRSLLRNLCLPLRNKQPKKPTQSRENKGFSDPKVTIWA